MTITSQSLANKYRPHTFDQLIGQSHISDILKQQIIKGHAHSNYIFFGPRGTGKTTTARLFAKGLNCSQAQEHNGNPCGVCDICQSISLGNALDVIEIDAASHTGVDNVREEIIGKASYPPSSMKRKVYIIDEVHMLSKGAFNALLKTMEEPAPHLTFILATTEIQKVPETIISRCQVFQFKKLTMNAIVSQLESICTAEGLQYDLEALKLIAELSEGCDRDAIKYVDQVSMFGNVSIEAVSSLLGIVSQHVITECLILHKKRNLTDLIHYVQTLHESGVDLTVFTTQTLSYLDRHFLDDPIYYGQLADLGKRILSAIKILGQPLLAYKVEYNREYSLGQTIEPLLIKTQTPSKPNTEIISPEHMQAISLPKEESKPSSTESLVDDLLGTTQEVSTTISNSVAIDTSTDEGLQVLFTKLLENMTKISAKSMLGSYGLFDEIKDGILQVVLFNAIALSPLSKQVVQAEIESQISQLTQSSLKVQYVVMTKEEYAASKL